MKTLLATLLPASLGLLLCIAALMAMGRKNRDDLPACPLALAESPYGQLLARLAKNKLNILHHGGQVGLTHADQPQAPHPRRLIGKRAPQPPAGNPSPGSLLAVHWNRDWIDQMLSAKVRRTNPNPITSIHLKYMNREIGSKFATAYAMDPTDYCIYNSYFMYLKENPWAPDRHKAGELALHTLQRCDKESESPAPRLTAAAAALDLAFIAIEDARKTAQGTPAKGVTPPPPPVCEVLLRLANQNLTTYEAVKQRFLETGRWQILPEQRRGELDAYADFVMRQFHQIKAWEERQPSVNKPML